MAVSRRLRYEILRRDGFTCRYCGAKAPDAKLTVDHVVPDALGGTDDPGNLVAACADCNAGKSSSAPDAPIVEAVSDDALRWANAMKEAAQIQTAHEQDITNYVAVFDASWTNWTGSDGESLPLPADYENTLHRYFQLGLEPDRITHAVDIAMKAKIVNVKAFRYFCGVCWRLLEERQEIARELLLTDEERKP